MITEMLFGRSSLSNAGSPSSWFVEWMRGGDTTQSGVAVNESAALTYSAVWCATRFLTSAIASLPLILYRQQPNDDRERAYDDYRYPLLKDRPNDEQDSYIFWEMQSAFLVNWGNCYAEIERFIDGRIYALWPLHPRDIEPFRKSPRAPIVYRVKDSTGRTVREVPASEMLHIAGPLSEDGITGRGVIRQARESIGLGLATERFGAGFFGNGARPGGLITHPGKLSEQAQENIRKGWNRLFQGPQKAHGIAVLAEDAKFTALGIPPEDAQFLETRQHNITEVARWYGLPPHVLADLSRATFSNIEQQDLDLVKHSLRTWYVRIERAIKRQLLSRDEDNLYWEFLLDALLRGDSVQRTQALTQQFLNGALTLNEWRRAENRNRVPGEHGDTHFVPLNLVPIDKVGEEHGADTDKLPIAADENGSEIGGNAESEESDLNSIAEAAMGVARDVVDRLGRIAANEFRRAAKTPTQFLHRIDRFLAEFADTIQAATAPVAVLFRATGDSRLPLIESSAVIITETLHGWALTAAEVKPDDLSATVEQTIATRWPTLSSCIEHKE